MDESALNQSLELYKAQLSQIEQAIAAAGDTEELRRLQSDLQELVSLTEGSLLSLKKSQLLKSLEEAENAAGTETGTAGEGTPLDDEYAAFQAAFGNDIQVKSTASPHDPPMRSAMGDNCSNLQPAAQLDTLPYSVKTDHRSSDGDDDVEDDSDNSDSDSESHKSRDWCAKEAEAFSSVDEELSNLTGMKCRAPFSHAWGKLDYHNALVMSAERNADTYQIQVKVMFTTPTHISMQPCKFYLDGRCRFSDEDCRYSHGYTVQLEQLREYLETDHSSVTVGMKCLAQYTDSVWYPATVTDVKADNISVHFDDYGEDFDVELSQIVPSVVHEESDSGSEADDREPMVGTSGERTSLMQDNEEEDEELPVFLWKPSQTTAAMGEWEAHTRGIGSKLMSKMGYVPGQGLGAGGQGKAEPVPILLLPQGKSLDRIMELKEMSGNSDLFNAMKKLEKQKQKADKKREEQAKAATSGKNQGHSNVFDFINKKLDGKKGDFASLAAAGAHHSYPQEGGHPHSQGGKRNIGVHELHKRSDRDINLQVFKTHEEIRSVEKQLDKLRESLARNENKDRNMAAQVRRRLAEQEAYLASLKSSSSALENHQRKRSENKKLTIF